MKRNVIVFSLIFSIIFGAFLTPAPEAKAIDPVTIAILTPIAIKAAQIAAPYVIRALKNMGVASLKALPDLLNLFKLPLGLLMVTIGAPFGTFKRGCTYLVHGFIAPFKLCFHVLMIPLSAFKIGFK